MRSGVTQSMICDPDTFVSDPGSDVHVLYSPVVKDGVLDVVESGRVSVSEVINSYAEQTDMAYILARLSAGDSSVLENGSGLYGDFTEFPHDRREMLQHVIDSQVYFDNLPSSTRAKFDNDFYKWLSSVGSEDWLKKMVKESAAVKSESEVVVSESSVTKEA